MSINKKEAIPIKVRPLIKWTGGKFAEYSKFSQFIPPFKNYYEPFFGGGGVFFALQPKGLSFLNDKSIDLIRFYKSISKEDFKNQLLQYASAWEQTTKLSMLLCQELLETFYQQINGKIDKADVKKNAKDIISHVDNNMYKPLFEESFIINADKFKAALIASIADKFNRICNIQTKGNKLFSVAELKQHIETAVKSGFYLYMRNLSNNYAAGQMELAEEKATANWYFLREFCYASMFRFNRKGGFNIPYGGIAYNKKNFSAKVIAITSHDTAELFRNSTFYNLDFKQFLERNIPCVDDFVFLDPPYDSEFSEYDQNAFKKEDQVRLRNSILGCRAKCMLVIKETEFIRDLYTGPPFNVIDFNKTYTYNVRGRNNRGTKHLIILNY